MTLQIPDEYIVATGPTRNIREELIDAARFLRRHWGFVSVWYAVICQIAFMHYARSRDIVAWFGDSGVVMESILRLPVAMIPVFVLLLLLLVAPLMFIAIADEWTTAFRHWLLQGRGRASRRSSRSNLRILSYCGGPLALGSVAFALLMWLAMETDRFSVSLAVLTSLILPVLVFGAVVWYEMRGDRLRKGTTLWGCAYLFSANYCTFFVTLLLVELQLREPGAIREISDLVVSCLVVGFLLVVAQVAIVAYVVHDRAVSPRMVGGVFLGIATLAMTIPSGGQMIVSRGLFLMGSGGEAVADLHFAADSESARNLTVAAQRDGPSMLLGLGSIDARVEILLEAGERLVVRPCGVATPTHVWLERKEIRYGGRSGEKCR